MTKIEVSQHFSQPVAGFLRIQSIEESTSHSLNFEKFSYVETIDELRTNLTEVIAMLLEDGEPKLQSKFVGTQQLEIG